MDDRTGPSAAAPAQPLPLERFAAILDTYGALPARWPAIERPAALALLRESEEARTLRIQAGRLDLVLDKLRPPLPSADPGSRLRRRGPAGARARLQRQRTRSGPILPRIGLVVRYAAVALIAFLIGFAAAWPLREDDGRPLPPGAPEGPIASEARAQHDVLPGPPD
jgi:hypothetical protein